MIQFDHGVAVLALLSWNFACCQTGFCEPDCENNGECVLSKTNISVCRCAAGFKGRSCGETAPTTTAETLTVAENRPVKIELSRFVSITLGLLMISLIVVSICGFMTYKKNEAERQRLLDEQKTKNSIYSSSTTLLANLGLW